MITIYDIAKKANVSAMTVSKVINQTGRISTATRERVQQVIDELGYIPNSNARSLVLQRTQMLSLLITDITNPFYTTLARGAGMQLTLVDIVCCSGIVMKITTKRRTTWRRFSPRV